MVRVKNVIITAFVAVWLFNGHYHHDGVGGMVAAATLEGGEEEADTTTRGTMMTTVVDGVPVPERKLSKKSKASKPDANDDNMLQQLWRALVFDKAMNVYRWMQLQQSVSEVTPRAGERNDGDGRELSNLSADALKMYEAYKTASCDDCRAFLSSRMQDPANEQEDFCEFVVDAFYGSDLKENPAFESSQHVCLDQVQCPLKTRGTPTTCCQSLEVGFCDYQDIYCKLSCNSGSCENYWFHTETKAECDTESTAIGCGTCKDKGPSDAILTKAGMPTEGFVSLCAGDSCVWSAQTFQCKGLKYYPALTTPEACKDACCNDDCAAWQFDAAGFSNQCWYGENCYYQGGLIWTYGGIRKWQKSYDEGTYQAPDCRRPIVQCAGDYLSDDPCCDQEGTGLVDPQYQCPQSKPTCVNYVYNDHWGSCE